MAITFGNLSLAEPSTITAKVATVTFARGSTTEHQEILCLGDPQSSGAIAAVSSAAPAAGDFALNVRQVGYVAPSTTVTISGYVAPSTIVTVANFSTQVSVSGYSTQVTVSGYVAPSTQVTVSGYVAPSTTIQVSSVGGVVATRIQDSSGVGIGGSTSSPNAGDNGLIVRQVGYVAPSTTVTVSGYVAPSTTVQVSSVGGTVTVQPNSTSFAINAGFHFDSSGGLLTSGSAGGSSQVTLSQVLSTSGGGVVVGDSVNAAIRVNVVAGAAGGSTIVSISHMIGNSSAADYMPVRIVDSSGTGFLAPGLDYTDGSTTSTLAAPGLAYVNGSNTTMRLVGTTQPLPVQLRVGVNTFASTTAIVNSSASTAVYTLVSSVASAKICCFAYSVTSTATATFAVEFMSSGVGGGGGSTGNVWGLVIGSGSSGVTGANLAVPHPSRIFAAAAGKALGLRLGSTGVDVRVSVATFTE